jgi:hypothetical protein
MWAAAAALAVTAATAAGLWISSSHRTPAIGQELVRVSPDDGHSYSDASLSADGKFIAYVSDRSGKPELWLQQIAGGDPIQLTHEKGDVRNCRFLPDGSRLIYFVLVHDGANFIASIPTLGGQPRILATAQSGALDGDLSHDGRRLMYFDRNPTRMMIVDLDGGKPRELTAWQKTLSLIEFKGATFTSDDRYILAASLVHAGSSTSGDGEWLSVPVDGGEPKATGAGAVLRAAGLQFGGPSIITGDRVLFAAGKAETTNIWEIRLSPDSMRVRGEPRQMTFGTESQSPTSVAAGIVALNVTRTASDLYLVPLSPDTGQPVGPVRRLTHDGRLKLYAGAGGNPTQAYFTVLEGAGARRNDYALDLETGSQSLVAPGSDARTFVAVSPDGRQLAYSVTDGDRFSIRVGDAGAGLAQSRLLCQGCGRAQRFSADGRYLMFQPEARAKQAPKQRLTSRLMDVATGQDRAWLEHPSDSITVAGTFGADRQWVVVQLYSPGSGASHWAILPWRPEPVPVSEWIDAKGVPLGGNYCPQGNFFTFSSGGKLMAIHFDAKSRSVSDPYEVKLPPGEFRPDDRYGLRGPGLVFVRPDFTSSVWMMKLQG